MEKPNKKDIEVIERKREFYPSDLESIEKQEEGWKLEILHDLVFEESSFVGDPEYPENLEGVLVCWDKKEKKVNILRYIY